MRLIINPELPSTLDLNRLAPRVNFWPTKSFPPKHSQWFRDSEGGIVLGCLGCKGMYSVNSNIHTIQQNGDIDPSWICVVCGSHAIVHLLRYDVDEDVSYANNV